MSYFDVIASKIVWSGWADFKKYAWFGNELGWVGYFDEIAGKIEYDRVEQALKKSFWKGN